MKTIWNTTKEGTQYWVSLIPEKDVLEFSCENVSPFVGGGYFHEISRDSFQEKEFRSRIFTIFGKAEFIEMLALQITLEKVPRNKFTKDKELRKERQHVFFQELLALQESDK